MTRYLVQVNVYREIVAEDDRVACAKAEELAKSLEADPRNVSYLVVPMDSRLPNHPPVEEGVAFPG